MQPVKTIFASLALLLPGLAAFSQTKPQVTDSSRLNKLHEIQPVEVRAVRAGTNDPFAKTNISGAELQKQNLGQDLPFLLQYTPSAVVTSDAGAGVGYTGLRIRGTDGTRINVTLNGVPVNDAESQGAFFVDLPDLASSTSSVQIQRGVGTSTNGAGAFGATMSISTLGQMEQAGAEANVSAGSFNTQKYTLHAGTGLLQGGWQFDVRLSKVSSDGYMERSASDLKALQFTAGWKINDKTAFHFMMLTGTEKTGQAWDGVPQDSLGPHRRFNELGIKSDGTYYNDQTDNYQQDYYQAFLDHKFNSNFTAHIGLFLTRGKGFYNEYQSGDQLSNYGINQYAGTPRDTLDLTRQLWLDNYIYGTVFSLMYEKKKTQLTFGGGWSQYEGQNYGYITWAQHDVPDDYKWYTHDAQKNDFNAYLKAQQYVGDKVILYGDVQFRTIGYFINGFRENPDYTPAVTYNFVNPKAGITWLLQNTGRQTQKLYASGAIASHEPSHDDFEVSPDVLPKPETLYDGEAGYELHNHTWNLGANLYYMYYKNQLVLTGQVNDVGSSIRTNVPVSYRAGIELMAGVKPLYWLGINANATFSQNRIKNFTEYLYSYDDGNLYPVSHGITDISFSPAVISGGTIAITPFRHLPNAQQLELDIMGKYVGKQYLDNTSNNDRSLKAYGLCNVLIRYSLKAHPFKELAFSLALNNVLNHLYESNGATYPYIENGTTTTLNYYFPQAGFNVLGGISVKW